MMQAAGELMFCGKAGAMFIPVISLVARVSILSGLRGFPGLEMSPNHRMSD